MPVLNPYVFWHWMLIILCNDSWWAGWWFSFAPCIEACWQLTFTPGLFSTDYNNTAERPWKPKTHYEAFCPFSKFSQSFFSFIIYFSRDIISLTNNLNYSKISRTRSGKDREYARLIFAIQSKNPAIMAFLVTDESKHYVYTPICNN